MNILCLSASGDDFIFAIEIKNKHFYYCKQTRSDIALVEIEKYFKEINFNLQDLDVIAVDIGPGSFTGTRVVTGFAKGLMFGNSKLKAVEILFNKLKEITPQYILKIAKQKIKNNCFVKAEELSPKYAMHCQAEKNRLMQVEIKKACVNDLDECVLICNETNLNWNKTQLEQELKNVFYVALINQKVIGFVIGNNTIDESELCLIAVKTSEQGIGIGEMLLNYFISQANPKIFLEVNENNYPAKNLYNKIGFKQISVRNKYYSDGSNAVVMLKEKK
ncbi:MAG: ribosomal protein S18-alanine N-acetyltransferase [Clostridia bacterium]